MATSLRGVTYLLDAKGRRKAVQIDLRKNAALWEDILDVAVARQRAAEPTESLDAVRRRLQKAVPPRANAVASKSTGCSPIENRPSSS